MRFDDRLSTVLRQPPAGKALSRIQYRQLVDLLGAGPDHSLDDPTSADDLGCRKVDCAYLRLAELAKRIPASERGALLEEAALRLRNPRLVAHLAGDEPVVAVAALAAASLGDEQWLDLIPALPLRARGLVRHRRDLGPRVEAALRQLGIADQGLPPPDDAMETRDESPARQPAESIEGIGAIVRRIEEFRKTRQQQEAEPSAVDAPRLPLDEEEARDASRSLESFDFATDAEGCIVWSDPAAAPMATGLRLAAPDADAASRPGRTLGAAFRRRQPIRAEALRIDGAPAIAGAWQVDAAPRFDRPGGRFIGYCGRMRRPAPALVPAPSPARESDADRMRQILHELRTPVNAIQGFAEVIQQQLFGPTPHEYRALAATIASDGARMLAGFEELERLVKLDSGALDIEIGESDLAAIVAMTVRQLEPFMTRKSAAFVVEQRPGALPVALAREETERLVWRLLATLAGASAPGETLRLKLRAPGDGTMRLVARLPASLAGQDDRALFHATATAQPPALSAGMFGTGFALRLAAAEAKAAGGSLGRRDGKLRLILPQLAGGGGHEKENGLPAEHGDTL